MRLGRTVSSARRRSGLRWSPWLSPRSTSRSRSGHHLEPVSQLRLRNLLPDLIGGALTVKADLQEVLGDGKVRGGNLFRSRSQIEGWHPTLPRRSPFSVRPSQGRRLLLTNLPDAVLDWGDGHTDGCRGTWSATGENHGRGAC